MEVEHIPPLVSLFQQDGNLLSRDYLNKLTALNVNFFIFPSNFKAGCFCSQEGLHREAVLLFWYSAHREKSSMFIYGLLV